MANKAKKQVCVTLTLPNGKRKYFRGATRKEALAKRDEAKIKIGCGIDIGNDMTFKELADLWLDEYKCRKDLHAKTIEGAEISLRTHVIPALGEYKIREIKPLHIDLMLKNMRDLSKSTQQKALIYAGTVFNKAVENGIIPRSPTFKKKPTAKAPEKVHALTEDECEVLLKAMKGTRVYPFIVLCLFCGFRRSEALGLMWKDVDFDKKVIRVERSLVFEDGHKEGVISNELKSSAGRRVVPMAPEVIEVLREEKAKSKSIWVFSMPNGKHLTENSWRRMWELIDFRTVGGPSTSGKISQTITFPVHSHQLRHTCCTRWINSGMNPKDAQYLMGHSTIDMTMSVYAEYQASQQLQKTAELINSENLRIKVV